MSQNEDKDPLKHDDILQRLMFRYALETLAKRAASATAIPPEERFMAEKIAEASSSADELMVATMKGSVMTYIKGMKEPNFPAGSKVRMRALGLKHEGAELGDWIVEIYPASKPVELMDLNASARRIYDSSVFRLMISAEMPGEDPIFPEWDDEQKHHTFMNLARQLAEAASVESGYGEGQVLSITPLENR